MHWSCWLTLSLACSKTSRLLSTITRARGRNELVSRLRMTMECWLGCVKQSVIAKLFSQLFYHWSLFAYASYHCVYAGIEWQKKRGNILSIKVRSRRWNILCCMVLHLSYYDSAYSESRLSGSSHFLGPVFQCIQSTHVKISISDFESHRHVSSVCPGV